MLHRFATKFAAGGAALPDRTIIAIASDATLDRTGDIMVASGCDATAYKHNPVVLRDHDPTRPVGTASVIAKSGRLEAVVKFAPQGISETADETYALVKAGVLNGVSIGFRPIESEPLSRGGVKFTKWELLEISIVAVPANPSALIVQRSYPRKAGASARGKVWASGISAADQERHGQVLKHLAAMAECHAAALDAHRNAVELHRQLRDRLVQLRAHMEKALEHMSRLGQRRPKPGDDDYPDAPDDPDASDPDDDNELALAALRRKREIAEMGRQIEAQDELYAALYPTPPRSFKVFDASRLVRAVISDESALSNGERLLLRGVELSDYAKTRGVLVSHDLAKLVAWCADLEFCEGQLIACAQFPPQGVSRKADRAFEAVRKGELPAASVGYSVLERRIGADGVTEVTRWALREWSLTKAGGNRGCRVLSVGGKLAPGPYVEPQRSLSGMAYESGAHFVADWRARERRRLNAYYGGVH
jgi:HK97 family phage prohead protease